MSCVFRPVCGPYGYHAFNGALFLTWISERESLPSQPVALEEAARGASSDGFLRSYFCSSEEAAENTRVKKASMLSAGGAQVYCPAATGHDGQFLPCLMRLD